MGRNPTTSRLDPMLELVRTKIALERSEARRTELLAAMNRILRAAENLRREMRKLARP